MGEPEPPAIFPGLTDRAGKIAHLPVYLHILKAVLQGQASKLVAIKGPAAPSPEARETGGLGDTSPASPSNLLQQ